MGMEPLGGSLPDILFSSTLVSFCGTFGEAPVGAGVGWSPEEDPDDMAAMLAITHVKRSEGDSKTIGIDRVSAQYERILRSDTEVFRGQILQQLA